MAQRPFAEYPPVLSPVFFNAESKHLLGPGSLKRSYRCITSRRRSAGILSNPILNFSIGVCSCREIISFSFTYILERCSIKRWIHRFLHQLQNICVAHRIYFLIEKYAFFVSVFPRNNRKSLK